MNAQQLKNSILQEAIEGRLVPQDPNDEPASLLLDKIRKEKAKLVKEGKLKKKDLEEFPVSDDEIPFEIPENWKWCKLGTIVAVLGGKRIPAGRKLSIENTGHIYIRVSDMKDNTVSTDNLQYVPEDIFPTISRYIINKEDVYITVAGTIGRVGKIPSELDGANLTENADRLVFSLINQDWLIKCLESNIVQTQITVVTTKVGQPKLAILRIQTLLIPLPPLEEQKRIVAKIEELLPKVDEYGKAQESLDKLNEGLPERLKKSILQEAIEGRLVPQDPNDEPASVLLDKIRKEKAKLVKEGKLKKKDLVETPIEEDEIPFKIPESWEWTRLGNHISAMSGLAYKKDDLASYSNEYVRVLRGGNISFGGWSIKDDDVMIGKQFVNEELILKKGMFISPAVTSLEHMGKTALIREDQNNVVAGGFVLMLLPHYKNEQYWEYLNVLFQTGYYRENCKSITNKSGQAFFNLSRAKLLEMLIPVPPLAEQKRIVDKLEQLLHEIDKLKV